MPFDDSSRYRGGGGNASDFWWHNDAQLRRLSAAGKTTSEAGNELGVTKNAVIGRVHRLGMKWGEKPSSPDFPPPNGCRYPHGHPKEPGFHFCGALVARPGRPYCQVHAQLCYRSVQPEQEAV